MMALEKNPARRYQSAAALARDIESHLQGGPVMARPVGAVRAAWRRLQRGRRRYPGTVAATLTLVAALALVVLAEFGPDIRRGIALLHDPTPQGIDALDSVVTEHARHVEIALSRFFAL